MKSLRAVWAMRFNRPGEAGHAFWKRARDRLRKTEGQGTVELALVLSAFLSIAIACGVLWRAFDEGLFVDHALSSASHHIQSVSPGTVGDVFLY